MELKVKTDIQSLKKEGIPIVIVGAVQESEAVAHACKEIGITWWPEEQEFTKKQGTIAQELDDEIQVE